MIITGGNMKTTIQDRVLMWLKTYGSITPREAYNEIGCYRLSAVIYDLKKDGYNIETERETAQNRWGDKVAYAKYVLKEEGVEG